VLIRKIKPSFFEVSTAMAFEYFADKKVDIAVIECGLGGRLDSTNVLLPDVCVITQIGIDHTQFLGKTIEKIAKEKLGIVKANTDVIVSDNNPNLKKLFKKNVSPYHLIYLDDIVKIKGPSKKFTVYVNPLKQSYTFTTHLPGNYQTRNASAAIMACLSFAEKNGRTLYLPYIKKGLVSVKKNMGYRGRLELIKQKGRTYIFDISHNPSAIKQTMKELGKTKIDVIVFGMMADKDYKSGLREIIAHSKKLIFTKPFYPRALEPEVLYKLAVKSKNKNLYTAKNLSETVKLIQNLKGVKTVLFIGSFFLVSDAIKALKLQKYFS
jgi:dihydrofolate synthase/folylpolyglutamate synthase